MKRCFLLFALLTLVLNVTAQTVVTEREGNIMLLNNNAETVIVNTKDASSPVVYGSKVYYLQTNAAIKGKIVSYDLATKQYIDVVSVGMKSDKGYAVKTEISNMAADTKRGIIYFSTKDTYNGAAANLTWTYNIANGKFEVFSDGKLSSIDDEGNITVLFDGKDEKGNFIRKAHYTPTRSIIRLEDKQYL